MKQLECISKVKIPHRSEATGCLACQKYYKALGITAPGLKIPEMMLEKEREKGREDRAKSFMTREIIV
jgi:hypothetical protein